MNNYESYSKQLKYYKTAEGKMAYFDKGTGKVILLLHGVPTSSWLYRKISNHLVGKGYRVIAPDMLGYGASDKPNGYEVYSAKKSGKRVLKLMEYLKISSWSQVFHDGGGLWTWELLKMEPSKVEKLIMLNTIVYQSGFKPPLKFEPGFISKIFTKLYCSSLGQMIVLNSTFRNGIKNKKVITKEMLQGYKLPLVKDGHHALYYFFTQTCKKINDYTELHQSINIPLSVIWGKHDDMLVWKNIKEQVQKNFNLKEENILELDAKHFIQEEEPILIAEKIAEFVQ